MEIWRSGGSTNEIYGDNNKVHDLVQLQHDRTKHIEVDIHFIPEKLQSELMSIHAKLAVKQGW